MNRIFGIMLSAALLCGSAGAAMATTTTTTDANCEAQLHAQVQALQAQVAALQASSDVQAEPATGFQVQTGG